MLGSLLALPGWTAQADGVTLDPVVDEVIEMLKAGVDEGVIVQWLASTERHPAYIGSQGVIALTRAGASERLMSNLLQLLGEQGTETPAAEPLPAPEPTQGEAPGSPASLPVAQGDAIGAVEVGVRLSAKRIWVDEDEPDRPREERWDIYLYLDGDLVAWTRPTLQGEPVEARRILSSGRHEMRVVLQRYEALRSGWLYDSLSVPTLIGFEAFPGDPIEIEVELKRLWGLWRDRRDGGPLSYVIRQGQEVLAEHGGAGGNPDRWQPVCEDVQVNFPQAETVPKRFRNSMSRCVRWSQLWTGAGQTTSRDEILANLEAYDFHPPLR